MIPNGIEIRITHRPQPAEHLIQHAPHNGPMPALNMPQTRQDRLGTQLVDITSIDPMKDSRNDVIGYIPAKPPGNERTDGLVDKTVGSPGSRHFGEDVADGVVEERFPPDGADAFQDAGTGAREPDQVVRVVDESVLGGDGGFGGAEEAGGEAEVSHLMFGYQ